MALVALELLVRAEVEARALRVVEERHVRAVLLLEVLERRRVTPLALLGPEQVPVVRGHVAPAVAACVRVRQRQVEHALGVALHAGEVAVGSEDRHPRVLAIVVVELEALLRRLPHTLAVAALAGEHVLALELVRLIARVATARPAQLVSAHVRLEALLVARLVALRAVGVAVLALERPARRVVVEVLLAALEVRPAHQVVRRALVLLVARLALLAGDGRGGVEALLGVDALLQIIVIVAAEALVARHLARAVDVALVAVGLVVERGVALRECARRRAEEIGLRLRGLVATQPRHHEERQHGDPGDEPVAATTTSQGTT